MPGRIRILMELYRENRTNLGNLRRDCGSINIQISCAIVAAEESGIMLKKTTKQQLPQ